jgi:hypothetical protein
VELRLARSGSRVIAYGLNGKSAEWGEFDGRVIRGVKLSAGEARVFEVLQ